MKKILMTSVLLFGLHAAGTALAATQQGFVQVVNTATTGLMNARFNVATNPKPGHEGSYFYTVTYKENTSVAFAGYDAVNNVSFACSFPASSPYFETAVRMAHGTGYGTILQVRRTGFLCDGLKKTQSTLAQ